MVKNYTDEKLAALLAHAQDGKLAYVSCCCFIGIPTADHPLKGVEWNYNGTHYTKAAETMGTMAGLAYSGLSNDIDYAEKEISRRRILIPMIRAEMKRRARLVTAQNAIIQEAVTA